MSLSDFKNIDFKNIGSLPIHVKAVFVFLLFLSTIGLGYYFLWSPSVDELNESISKEADLRKVFLDKESQAINLDGYRLQMVEIEKTFGAMLKQLPDKSKMDGLLMDINQAGLSRNLEFDLFKPGKELQSEFYAEMPISIKVLGTYDDLGLFATDISNLSRIVTLNDLAITLGAAPMTKDMKSGAVDAMLSMEVTAKTYRYLDADEISAQKKAESLKNAKNVKSNKES